MTDEERLIVEELASAYRRHDPRKLAFHRLFYDATPEARMAAFDLALSMRPLEAALDAQGHSTTVHAVMAVIDASTSD